MAKVLISLPDDLLSRIDDTAGRAGETRSGFLQRIARREVAASNARLRQELEELLDGISVDLGDKSAAEWVRFDREHRDDRHLRSDDGR